jgi:hypothetical protein
VGQLIAQFHRFWNDGLDHVHDYPAVQGPVNILDKPTTAISNISTRSGSRSTRSFWIGGIDRDCRPVSAMFQRTRSDRRHPVSGAVLPFPRQWI